MSHQRRNRRAQISHTDDWLLTYADTITLLFCLFVVLASQAHKPRLAPDPMPAVPVEQTVAPANFIDWKPPFKPTTLGNEAADEDAHAEAEDRTTPTPVENPLLSSAPRDAPPAAERTIIVDPLDERSAAALSGSVSLAALPALADVAPQQPSDAPLIPLPEIVAHVRPEGAAHLEQKGDRITTLAFESAAFFSRGTATLNGSGKVILQEVVGNLKSEEYQDYMVTIEGHTDDAPINTAQFPSNWSYQPPAPRRLYGSSSSRACRPSNSERQDTPTRTPFSPIGIATGSRYWKTKPKTAVSLLGLRRSSADDTYAVNRQQAAGSGDTGQSARRLSVATGSPRL